MSDSGSSFGSPEPAPKPARKRKSAATPAASKKARTSAPSATSVSNAAAQTLVTSVLANSATYTDASNPQAIGNALVSLAVYARQLETAIASGAAAGPSSAPAAKSPEEIEAAAEKLRKAAVSGITKQMKWRPSCKTGSAKWVYDGVCSDPAVFGALMGLGGPPTFKMKKFSRDAFESAVGEIQASSRYSLLSITSQDVNVRWSDDGEFKFSGSYGV